MRFLTLFPFTCCAALLAACGDNASNVYSDSATSGKVLQGSIISLRLVTIKPKSDVIGELAGGAAGVGAGSQVGHGSGTIAADIGGALIGAVAGGLIQESLGSTQGTEYLIKLDPQYIQDFYTVSKKVQTTGKQSVEQDMASANVGAKTDIVSIAEKTDPALHEGMRVYIIYNDDRARLVAMK